MIKRNSYSLFQEPWWLDLAAAGDWDEVVVKNAAGQLLARLPFCVKRRYGFKALAHPHLTPFLGPWFDSIAGSQSKAFSDQYELTAELISLLPRFDVFRQSCCPEIVNWLPFHWAGFVQQTKYTYRLHGLTNLEALWNGFHQSTRRAIRKADTRVEVVASNDVELLCDVHERTYSQRAQAMPYKRKALYRIVEGALRTGHGRLLHARDDRGNIHAVNFLVFDERCAYYLVGGSDDRFRESGAPSLLMWHAIKFAAAQSAVFDFEGSMVQGIERFFRNFNGALTPINRLYKMGRVFGLARHVQDAVIAFAGRPPHSN
jgi:hypothetical protein